MSISEQNKTTSKPKTRLDCLVSSAMNLWDPHFQMQIWKL